MNAKKLGCVVFCGYVLTTALAVAQTGAGSAGASLAVSVVGQQSDNRREAKDLLRMARTAMKDGDLKQARAYLERAESLGLRYTGILNRFNDTPAKVRADLEQLEQQQAKSAAVTGPVTRPESGPAAATSVAGLPARAATAPAPVTGAPRAFASTTSDGAQVVANPFAGPAAVAAYPQTGASPLTASQPAGPVSTKDQALQLLAAAKLALDRGELAQAKQLAQQAHDLRVPDSQFAPGDMRPWSLLLEIARAERQAGQPVAQALYDASQPSGGVRPAAAPLTPAPTTLAQQPALAQQPSVLAGPGSSLPVPPLADEAASEAEPGEVSQGYELIRQGEQALQKRDIAQARELFREAWEFEGELDPEARQRLQDHLQLLRAADNEAGDRNQDEAPAPSAGEQAIIRRFLGQISRQQAEANRLLEQNPKQAWERLKELRSTVAEADVPEDLRSQLLSRLDRNLQSVEEFIETNRVRIETDETNREVLARVDRRRQHQVDVDNQLAKLVDEFNQLMDQERYSEAVVVAKKARELDADNPTVESMLWKSRFAERLMVEMSLRSRTQEGTALALSSVSESAVPFDDMSPYRFPQEGNPRYWDELSRRRMRTMKEGRRQPSEASLEIQRALRNKVEVSFSNQPLAQVMEHLGNLAGVNIYLDPQGLAAEGVTSDTPVTINLNQQIQLKSALNLILQAFHLTYVVQDEVLKVTSESIRNQEVYVETYDVADLVIPIPNFLPSFDMGLPAAIREAHNVIGYGTAGRSMQQAPLTVLAENQTDAAANQSVLAQMASSGALPSAPRGPQPIGAGPGGLGGGAQADFDTLIDLIITTIAPDTWVEVGGEGSVSGFPTNLSLVVSQTQEVHDQIADLLEQLRRLQDLQVTIEVRFITLNDNFFERIGVDFDFDIDDNVQALPPDDSGPSVTVGLDPNGNPTADLDLSFTQDSFGAAVPAFGGFDAATAANFGFAILSDIEAFFLIQAAQGDTRTNILQAPKVTLFNGQLATVSDTSQRPFVTSVTPVVGDFAAAQQPVIVVLNEGTSLSVQAVVSPDRRFVRLTMVPFFSKIGDVEEFTFEGKRTSNTGTTTVDPTDETKTVNNDAEEVIEGTTVQLPTFSFTSVSTTVSVPDGGTILLGGIKRLSEGRNERGVPMLSKLPYVSRLFKNVGIGRTTQSLMMMVTPRIIIQEEEEERLGVALP